MGIFNLFRNRKPVAPVTEGTQTTQVEPATPVKLKRDYKSAPGHYKPKSNFVRLDNIAAAAGVRYSKVTEAIKAQEIETNRRHRKCFVRKEDAIILHTCLWNEKA